MKAPVPDYLLEIRDACSVGADGELADYIPELAAGDADRFAVAVCTMDGVVYTAGDAVNQDRGRARLCAATGPGTQPPGRHEGDRDNQEVQQ